MVTLATSFNLASAEVARKMASTLKNAAQHGVHQDGWILTAKLAFFMALGFVRFVGESTSLQPPVTRAVGTLNAKSGAFKNTNWVL